MPNRVCVPLSVMVLCGCSDIIPPFDLEDLFQTPFDLTVAPAELIVTSGATSAPLTVTLVPREGFSKTVDVEVLNLPPGAATSPASTFGLRPNQSRKVVFSTTGVSPGDYWPQFRASAGVDFASRTIRLIVVEPPGTSAAPR